MSTVADFEGKACFSVHAQCSGYVVAKVGVGRKNTYVLIYKGQKKLFPAYINGDSKAHGIKSLSFSFEEAKEDFNKVWRGNVRGTITEFLNLDLDKAILIPEQKVSQYPHICTLCKAPAYNALFTCECSNPNCRNYKK